MDNYIVITSIFKPTEAVKKFATIPNFHVVVVGDKKSPSDYIVNNCTFLPVQKKLGYHLEDMLPYNHYCRKMLGYVYAIKNGARLLADSDDDNIPYDDWSCPNFDDTYETLPKDAGFVNIYKYFSQQSIWPRGFPLNLITQDKKLDLKTESHQVGIWQGLADKSPDVDAIYRLVDNRDCFFEKRNPIVLERGTYCPFNSQNTFFRRELFALIYLPATVTFRFTDILRGLVAQTIAQVYNYKLGFFNATVIQERNEHDYMKDFQSEIPMYLDAVKVIDIVRNAISSKLSVGENLYCAYRKLYENGIVQQEELKICKAWLDDISG